MLKFSNMSHGLSLFNGDFMFVLFAVIKARNNNDLESE
jgi:hypothetical protein